MGEKKVGANVFLGAVLGLLLTSRATSDTAGFVYCLFFFLAAGAINNFDDIDRATRAALALPLPVTVLLVDKFQIYARGIDHCWFSGLDCSKSEVVNLQDAVFLSIGFVAVFIFSSLSDWVIAIFAIPDSRATMIRKRVAWITAMIGAVLLLLNRIIELGGSSP